MTNEFSQNVVSVVVFDGPAIDIAVIDTLVIDTLVIDTLVIDTVSTSIVLLLQ